MNPYRIFDQVFSNEVAIAIVVFGLVCLAMLVAMVLSHRRRRAGNDARQVEKNTVAEVTFALVVAAVVGYVLYLSFHTTGQEATGQTPHPAAARVTVTGYQWCWRFGYPGHGFSRTGECEGEPSRPTMVIPVGEPVTIDVHSQDVIHSWWVPALRYKMDAFPGHTNSFTITVDHAGRWLGHCAEFCGSRHYAMEFYVKAVPAKQYHQWLAAHAGSGLST